MSTGPDGYKADPADRADAIEALTQAFVANGKDEDESREVATAVIDAGIADREAQGGSSKPG